MVTLSTLRDHFLAEVETARAYQEGGRYRWISRTGERIRGWSSRKIAQVTGCTPIEEETGRVVLHRLSGGDPLLNLPSRLEAEPIEVQQFNRVWLVIYHLHNWVIRPLNTGHLTSANYLFWEALGVQMVHPTFIERAGLPSHLFNTLPSARETFTGRLILTFLFSQLLLHTLPRRDVYVHLPTILRLNIPRFLPLTLRRALVGFHRIPFKPIAMFAIANPYVRAPVYALPGFRFLTRALDQVVFESIETLGYIVARSLQIALVRLSRATEELVPTAKKSDDKEAPRIVVPHVVGSAVRTVDNLGKDLFGKRQKEAGLSIICGIATFALNNKLWWTGYGTGTWVITALEMLNGTNPWILAAQGTLVLTWWFKSDHRQLGDWSAAKPFVQNMQVRDLWAGGLATLLIYKKQHSLVPLPFAISAVTAPVARTAIAELVSIFLKPSSQ